MSRVYSPERRAAAFWKKVKIRSPDECWEFTGAKYGNGYGNFWDGEKTVGAHIFAYRITEGEVPKGLYVCHSCDNQPCCNPKHLFLGTPTQNQQDMFQKGRANKSRGENHPKTKLKSKDVLAIRCDNRSLRKIAQDYNVTCTTIFGIKHHTTWKHL